MCLNFRDGFVCKSYMPPPSRCTEPGYIRLAKCSSLLRHPLFLFFWKDCKSNAWRKKKRGLGQHDSDAVAKSMTYACTQRNETKKHWRGNFTGYLLQRPTWRKPRWESTASAVSETDCISSVEHQGSLSNSVAGARRTRSMFLPSNNTKTWRFYFWTIHNSGVVPDQPVTSLDKMES